MTGHSWSNKLAKTWTNNVAPSRPTVCELALFTKILRSLQSASNMQLSVLILGSTPEFRDWAYEENLQITVVDYSREYHDMISREVRHKNMHYELVLERWEDMDFNNRFDLVIGDLTIGNIQPNKLDTFLANVCRSLTVGGYFLGKNVFRNVGRQRRSPEEVIASYYKGNPYHPYSALVYELAMSTVGEGESHLNFQQLFRLVTDLRHRGLLKEKEFEYFCNVGLDADLDFTFFIPSIEEFECAVRKSGLYVESIQHTEDVFTKFYPLYILRKGVLS